MELAGGWVDGFSFYAPHAVSSESFAGTWLPNCQPGAARSPLTLTVEGRPLPHRRSPACRVFTEFCFWCPANENLARPEAAEVLLGSCAAGLWPQLSHWVRSGLTHELVPMARMWLRLCAPRLEDFGFDGADVVRQCWLCGHASFLTAGWSVTLPAVQRRFAPCEQGTPSSVLSPSQSPFQPRWALPWRHVAQLRKPPGGTSAHCLGRLLKRHFGQDSCWSGPGSSVLSAQSPSLWVGVQARGRVPIIHITGQMPRTCVSVVPMQEMTAEERKVVTHLDKCDFTETHTSWTEPQPEKLCPRQGDRLACRGPRGLSAPCVLHAPGASGWESLWGPGLMHRLRGAPRCLTKPGMWDSARQASPGTRPGSRGLTPIPTVGKGSKQPWVCRWGQAPS